MNYEFDRFCSTKIRFILIRWLEIAKKKRHLKIIGNIIKKRHELYLCQNSFHSLKKNIRISAIYQIYSYIKIQKKPNLALFLLSFLRKDDLHRIFYQSFYKWLVYVRRRRRWHQFVFENICQADYNPIKRKVFAAIQNKNYSSNFTSTQWMSKSFIHESLHMYNKIFHGENEGNDMFLIFNDAKKCSDIQQKELKSNYLKQVRQIFFEAWKSMNFDNSLFLRVVTIYSIKRHQEEYQKELIFEEKIVNHYKQVISFFNQNKIASESKVKQALKLIQENNKRAFVNMNLLLQRDQLICSSKDSRSHQKISDINKKIETSFKVLIPILHYLSTDQSNNDQEFMNLRKLSTKIPDFSESIVKIHEIIRADKKRINEMKNSCMKMKNASLENEFDKVSFNSQVETSVDRINKSIMSIGKGEISKIPLSFNNQESISKEEENNKNFENVENVIHHDFISKTKSEIQENSSNQFDTVKNDSVSVETEIIQDSNQQKILNRQKEFKRSQNALLMIQDRLNSSAQLTPGFSDVVMQSVGVLGDINEQDFAEKYKIYIEMLFGKRSSEVDVNYAKNMRNKLISDFLSRKPSKAASGLNTRLTQLPITPAIEKYRNERKKSQKIDSEQDVNRGETPLKRKFMKYKVLFAYEEDEIENEYEEDYSENSQEEDQAIFGEDYLINNNDLIYKKTENQNIMKEHHFTESCACELSSNCPQKTVNCGSNSTDYSSSRNECDINQTNNDSVNKCSSFEDANLVHSSNLIQKNDINDSSAKKIEEKNRFLTESSTFNHLSQESNNSDSLSETDLKAKKLSNQDQTSDEFISKQSLFDDHQSSTPLSTIEKNESNELVHSFQPPKSSISKIVFHIYDKCVNNTADEDIFIEIDSNDFPPEPNEESKITSKANIYTKRPRYCRKQKESPKGTLNVSKSTFTRKVCKITKPTVATVSRMGSFDESKVVSFAGGGRGIGSNKPSNFVNVRIANTRRSSQMRPLNMMYPIVSGVKKQESVACSGGSIIISHYGSAEGSNDSKIGLHSKSPFPRKNEIKSSVGQKSNALNLSQDTTSCGTSAISKINIGCKSNTGNSLFPSETETKSTNGEENIIDSNNRSNHQLGMNASNAHLIGNETNSNEIEESKFNDSSSTLNNKQELSSSEIKNVNEEEQIQSFDLSDSELSEMIQFLPFLVSDSEIDEIIQLNSTKKK